MSRILLTTIIVSLMLVGCEVERPKKEVDVNNLNMELEAHLALQEANKIFAEAKEQETDLSNGPCLSNALFGNPDYSATMWVFDIAHNPRQELDNLPENQCSAFREGKAHNYIEYSLEGELIKIYSPLLQSE